MRRRFYNIEDVFKKGRKKIDVEGQKILFDKIDNIERRVSDSAEEIRLQNMEINAETLKDAQLLAIC